MRRFLFVLSFVLLSGLYYYFQFEEKESIKVIITVVSFLFAIFAGFFIARQAKRYTLIRHEIAIFDGEMSSLYRTFGHLGKKIQDKMGEIAKKHYRIIKKKHRWDHHFTHKSTTLTNIHHLLEESPCKVACNMLQNWSLRSIYNSLESLQVSRKQMINLYLERIPTFQWMLIYLLAIILLITITFLPTMQPVFSALLKGALGTAVVFVIVLLHEFDNLHFFEGRIGENSAQDVLDIIAGKK